MRDPRCRNGPPSDHCALAPANLGTIHPQDVATIADLERVGDELTLAEERAGEAHGLERRVEVAVHHHQPRAGCQRLGELAASDLARRQDDVARHSGRGGIGAHDVVVGSHTIL